MRECIACHEAFEPDSERQKRCRRCITEDRRATKAPELTQGSPPDEGSLDDLLAAVERRGYVVQPRATTFGAPRLPDTSDGIEFGVVSDPHIGSKYQQMSALKAAYRWFDSEGVRYVLNAGDITDGSPNMHLGMAEEQFMHDPITTVDYVVEHYPRLIETAFIGGNHDWSWFKNEQIKILEAIASKRSDMHYLGPDVGQVDDVTLFHPSGGGATWLTQVRRFVDRQPAIWALPAVLLVGHLHRFSILPEYRGVLGIELPGLQMQTPFLARKAIVPNIGALIVKVGGLGQMNIQWQTYDAKENDY